MRNKLIKIFRILLNGWDFARFFKLGISLIMLAGYFSTKESIYLAGAAFLGIQAIFNFGCPGGSCQTNTTESKTPPMKFKKLDLDSKEDVQ
jgi:hypothetical protein